MARRISWTNNSSGHSGTYVYRAPTLDPQNLPAPVATVDPVAQGETAEWIDSSGEYGCYAVQDFDGQDASALSTEVCIADPWANVQVGDEIGGGIYAGMITYEDGRQFHIVAANQAHHIKSTRQRITLFETDDGVANTDVMIAEGISAYPAADHCVSSQAEGFEDWYFMAENECVLVSNSLHDHPEFAYITSDEDRVWTSTDTGENWGPRYVRFSTANPWNNYKASNALHVIPVRRVPV